MKPRIPLYAKILAWFFLNLLLVAALLYGVFRWQTGAGLGSLLSGQVTQRLLAVGGLIAAELRDRPRESWDAILARYSTAYGVELSLVREGGDRLAGSEFVLPPEVAARTRFGRPSSPFPPGPGGPGGSGGLWGGRGPTAGRRGSPGAPEAGPTPPLPPLPPVHDPFLIRTADPPGYWMGVRFAMSEPERFRPLPCTLVMRSASLAGGGLLFDYTPWVLTAAIALLLSALFWLLLVRGISRSIATMARTTGAIAEGRFDARADARRQDELGHLAEAINRMAVQLQGFVAGQRRFLGDVAHELCSPIARMQVALGILEARPGQSDAGYVADLREELDHMSGMVNELLSFSKASLGGRAVACVAVDLREVTEQAGRKEVGDRATLECDIEPGLRAQADPELLRRAVANLLRNAVRYAGSAGPIQVRGRRQNGQVVVTVADAGPGVPADALPRLFEPFFRVDEARTRETGGTGLGLAIVKTCVEACGGAVTAANRQPSGLEVTLRLPAAQA